MEPARDLPGMMLGEAIVVVLLAGWLFATILYQIFTSHWVAAVRRWDLFHWLVTYHLFSRSPRDFTLRYRDRLPSGVMDEWTVVMIASPHRWWHAIWHPEQRALNAIRSMVDDLVRLTEDPADQRGRRPMADRFIYRSVLRHVMRLPGPSGTTGRQFCIDETGGRTTQPAATRFCSDLHPHEIFHGS